MKDIQPGKIYKRNLENGKHRYECQIYLPQDERNPEGKKKKTIYAKTKKDCQKKALEFCNSFNQTHCPSGKNITVRDFSEFWLNDLCRGKSGTTVQRYRENLRVHILPYIGDVLLKDLNTLDCQVLANKWIEAGYRINTILTMKTTLSSMLQSAVKINYISSNPCRNIQIEPETTNNQPLIDFEPETFFEYAKEHNARNLQEFQFLFLTGLRISELLGLTWDRVDLDNKTIRIDHQFGLGKNNYNFYPTKTKNERIVPLPDSAVEILIRQRIEQNTQKLQLGEKYIGNPVGVVFTDRRGRRKVKGSVEYEFNQICAACNFHGIKLHGLRHMYAVLAITSGVDFKTISEIMGHSSISFTMKRYAFVTDSMRSTAAEKISENTKFVV